MAYFNDYSGPTRKQIFSRILKEPCFTIEGSWKMNLFFEKQMEVSISCYSYQGSKVCKPCFSQDWLSTLPLSAPESSEKNPLLQNRWVSLQSLGESCPHSLLLLDPEVINSLCSVTTPPDNDGTGKFTPACKGVERSFIIVTVFQGNFWSFSLCYGWRD